MTPVTPQSARFDILYCAGKSANAYNVDLQSAVIAKSDDGFKILYGFGDRFPEGVTLSYETGKAMMFTLSPIDAGAVPHLYIAVRGNFTNEGGKARFEVFDVFKYSEGGGGWVRTMGAEDSQIRAFVRKLPFTDKPN